MPELNSNYFTRQLVSDVALVLVSLPPALLDTDAIANLYRVRWQVELVIKRLKSLLQVDELRARKHSQLADLYLHGKLLYVAVMAKIAQQRWPQATRKMDETRQVTYWRLWRSVADDMKAGFKACFPHNCRFADAYLKSIAERPRKRPLQTLPTSVRTLIETCRKLGVSQV